MSYCEYSGNLFNSRCQTIVNTVNCVGVMGKGVALEFRRRFPSMYQDYREVCEARRLKPGGIHLFTESTPWVLNVAVKDHWRFPSRLNWVDLCLRNFVRDYQRLGITSIAFPWIGAMNGGLPWNQVHALMRTHLEPISDIDVEVIEFDPDVPDDLFLDLKRLISTGSISEISDSAGITRNAAKLLIDALEFEDISSMAQLCNQIKLSSGCVDRIYDYVLSSTRSRGARQLSLW